MLYQIQSCCWWTITNLEYYELLTLKVDNAEGSESVQNGYCFSFNGGPGEIRTPDLLNANQANTIKLLNKLPLSTIEAFSNLSKGYICQVKSGKRPASERLLSAVEEYIKSKRPKTDYISLFVINHEL